jgi:hypothetical protein
MDFGLSDHYAQVLTLCIKVLVSRPLKVRMRIFDEGSIKELKYNLNKELWEEVFVEPDVNGKFNFIPVCSILLRNINNIYIYIYI